VLVATTVWAAVATAPAIFVSCSGRTFPKSELGCWCVAVAVVGVVGVVLLFVALALWPQGRSGGQKRPPKRPVGLYVRFVP
jgi:hypothetical protein